MYLCADMPKKTKREKILAEYRRKISAFTPSVHVSAPKESLTSMTPSPFQSVFTYQKKESPIPAINSVLQEEYKTIRKDLAKTLILACVMVSIELAVYWKIG